MVAATTSAEVGLCLSGGGFRAMLYHLGATRRLLECGLLARIDRVSSVSGGSITAAVLGAHWEHLKPDEPDAIERFDVVERPLFDLAGRTIDWTGAAGGLARGRSAGEGVARLYDRHLLDGRTLQDLPDTPRFIFNSTNMQTGNLFRWSKPYAADHGLGRIDSPKTALALVLAASSAFPPFLSPVKIKVPGDLLAHNTGKPIDDPPGSLWLADGGVYDNLGLQPLERFGTVYASDGGGRLDTSKRLRLNWLSQSVRTTLVIDSQVRRLRQRGLVRDFKSGARTGTLWTIATRFDDYPAASKLRCPTTATASLARVGTRLAPLSTEVRYRLMNWGYASADAAIRSFVDKTISPPEAFPYPGGVGE